MKGLNPGGSMLWFEWSSGFVVLSWEGLLLVLTDISTTWAMIRAMMASVQVVETSVNTNNSPSQDYTTTQTITQTTI